MKKLFAALLAISVTAALTGCNKPAKEQLIDKISEDTSVSSAMANESENVSEAETTTETKNAVETAFESVFAEFDKETGPRGKWLENRFYIYDFADDGTMTLDIGSAVLNGTYTYDDSVLSIEFENSWDTVSGFRFTADYTDDVIHLTYTGPFSDVSECLGYAPYEPEALVTGYFSFVENLDFTLEKIDAEFVPAEQKDLQGIWVDRCYDDYASNDIIYIWDGDMCTKICKKKFFGESYIQKSERTVAEGKEVFEDGEYNSFTVFKDRIFIVYSGGGTPDVLEKYTGDTVPITEEMTGEYYINTDEYLWEAYLENGKGEIFDIYDTFEKYPAEIIADGNNLRIAIKKNSFEYAYEFACYKVGDIYYLDGGEDGGTITKADKPNSE